MIVGILSDTHDRLDATRAAVSLLQQQGSEFFIHCGDVGSIQILDCLAGLPSAFVYGNNDWDRTLLKRYAADIQIQCLEDSGTLSLGGKTFVVMHGDDMRAMRRTIDAQSCDYLLLGHSHVRTDQRAGRIRIINPGALHRAAVKTVATLDTSTDALRFHTVA
jgi:putative phosphoesterase